MLIGASAFEHPAIDDLGSVVNNVDRLAGLLRDPTVWGLPAEHCVSLVNPAETEAVLDAVRRARQEADDTLLVYYAGHGMLDAGDDLLLALPRSDPDVPYLSLQYDQLRRQVLAAACPSKVVILDCCFAARAFAGRMSAVDTLKDHAAVNGTTVLAAAAETKLALAPEDETYTAFTGELIELLESGIADGDGVLTVEVLCWQLRTRLRAKGRPLPQHVHRNEGGAVSFARNRWSAIPAAPEVVGAEPLPDLPATPAELLADHGDDALFAAGRIWPDQRVASTLGRLIDLGDDERMVPILSGLSARDTAVGYEVCAQLIEDYGQDRLAGLTKGFAQWPPEPASALIDRLLTSAAGAPLADDVAEAFVAAARERPSRIIELITGLLVRDRAPMANRVIDLVAATVHGQPRVAVADELREAGRTAQAFLLYAKSVELLADRPPAQLAEIAAGMVANGRRAAGARLVQVAVAEPAGVEERAGVIAAFARTGALDEELRAALAEVASTLDEDGAHRLFGRLREDAGTAAVDLVVQTATHLPPERSASMVNRLVADGWSADALVVLRAIGAAATPAGVEVVSRMVVDTPAQRRKRELLAAVPAEPLDRLADLYELLSDDPDRSALLEDDLNARPGVMLGVMCELLRSGRPGFADRLFRRNVPATGHAGWDDIEVVDAVLAAVARHSSARLMYDVITEVRSGGLGTTALFVLGERLWRRGRRNATTALLAEPLWLPPGHAGHAVAAAVGNALRNVDVGAQRVPARLANEREPVITFRWGGGTTALDLWFTDERAVWTYSTGYTYDELAAASGLYAIDGRVRLDGAPGRQTKSWPSPAIDEAVQLLRLVQPVVREVFAHRERLDRDRVIRK